MDTSEDLYALFGLPQDCTDEQLRKAYRQQLHSHHPDHNPQRAIEATKITQELNNAYELLKGQRDKSFETESKGLPFTFTIRFDFDRIDIDDIAVRKENFRLAWEVFQKAPNDIIAGLKLIHAALEAERHRHFHDLLVNPFLIDAATLLLELFDRSTGFQTLRRWCDYLQLKKKLPEAMQILEDAYSAGDPPDLVVYSLQDVHYRIAQGYHLETKTKPEPQDRIYHLTRVLELGREADYIYKLLAKAHFELGEEHQARSYLQKAYKLNPELSGVVKLSRALGLLPESNTPKRLKKKRSKYIFNRPEQIPLPNQILEWEEQKDLATILQYASLSNYSPRIRSKAKTALHQIALSLGSFSDPDAQEALFNLLESDTRFLVVASILSLSKIGDHKAYQRLQTLEPRSKGEQVKLQYALDYLESRLRNNLPTSKSSKDLIAQAKNLVQERAYGRARILLEKAILNLEVQDPSYIDTILLFAECLAEMEDLRAALNLITPTLGQLHEKIWIDYSEKVQRILWSLLSSLRYDKKYDDCYHVGIKININRALTSTHPKEVLESTWQLTRWMEILGDRNMTQWIQNLIRTEAPGTIYVDKHDREDYVRSANLSQYLKLKLKDEEVIIKNRIPPKLRQVLKAQKEIAGFDKPLLNRGE